MNPIEQIDFLAKKFLDNREYAFFVDLLTSINNRLGETITKESQEKSINEETKQIKYPHDLEIDIVIKLFRNSQIGERVELVERTEKSFLKKLGIGDDPNLLSENLIDLIGQL